MLFVSIITLWGRRRTFNFFVISFFPTWLLWAITLPFLSISATAVTLLDLLDAVIFLVLLMLETTRDHQQWRFHVEKDAAALLGLPFGLGFCTTGCFGYSRHLNVFCAGACVLSQWIGCVALFLLHFPTALITVPLSRRKYLQYAVYQHATPMLMPALTSSTDLTEFLIRKRSTPGRRP